MPTSSSEYVLRDALLRITHEIVEGCKHGFFEYAIVGETLRQGKCSLTFKAGKSYRFSVSESDFASPLTISISDPHNQGASSHPLLLSDQHDPDATSGQTNNEQDRRKSVGQALRQNSGNGRAADDQG